MCAYLIDAVSDTRKIEPAGKMASQAAYAAEKVIGHDENAILKQDVSSYKKSGENETMKALVWQGKNKVEIGKSRLSLHTGLLTQLTHQSKRPSPRSSSPETSSSR